MWGHSLLRWLVRRAFPLPFLLRVGVTPLDAILFLLVVVALVVGGWVTRNETAASGQIAAVVWIPLFLAVMHRSPVSLLGGLPFDRAIPWHATFAFFAFCSGAWHMFVALKEHTYSVTRLVEIYGSAVIITGFSILGVMVVIFITALRPIRLTFYQLWVRCHGLLAVCAIVFCVVHGAATVLAGFALLVADRLYGVFYQSFFKYKSMTKHAVVEKLPGGVVCLSMPRDSAFNFTAGQFMFARVPAVSRTQWHPFSISSAPCDTDVLTFHMKALGGWTTRLAALAPEQGSPPKPLKVYIQGPIGAVGLSMDSSLYSYFVIIAGGIGITPCISIYRQLMAMAEAGRSFEKVLLLWSIRDAALIDSVYNPMTCCHEQRTSPPQLSSPLPGTQSVDSEQGTAVFEARIYLTQASAMLPISMQDLPLNMTAQLFKGCRPDYQAAFTCIHDTVSKRGGGRIAVLTCGPSALTLDVAKCAKRASIGRGVKFDLHVEQFSW